MTPLGALEKYGLLLESDSKLPNLAGLVAGEPVRGSWWGHAKGHDIFREAVRLGARADVLVVKLISGKRTYVHRSFWEAVLAVGMARERWQTQGLSRSARALLVRTDREGAVACSGESVRELERRLLVYADSVHTDSGAHAKQVESWEHWGRRVHCPVGALPPAEGKRRLEEAAAEIGGRVPWAGPSR